MKSIMFNEKVGMQTATLNGSKTRTTRKLGVKVHKLAGLEDIEIKDAKIENGIIYLYFLNKWYKAPRENQPKYKVGEVVAIKQSYKDIGFEPGMILYRSMPEIDGYRMERADTEKGWNNKMFVCNNLMPHKIQITNIKLERLQDISDEDCLKEGIIKNQIGYYIKGIRCTKKNESYTIRDEIAYKLYPNLRQAFAGLINKISGKGTWESNEWHIVYYYELVE